MKEAFDMKNFLLWESKFPNLFFFGFLLCIILEWSNINKSCHTQRPVARSLVSANRWLRGIKMYRFPWYSTLVSTNHASNYRARLVFCTTSV